MEAEEETAKQRRLLDDWEIDAALLSLHELIASGSYGNVHRGTLAGQVVAVKILRPSHDTLQDFTRELAGLRRIRHPNVVQLIGASAEPSRVCIVTEFCIGGSLLAFLQQSGRLPARRQLELVLDVARGMDFIHRLGFMHRDLKASNVYVPTSLRRLPCI